MEHYVTGKITFEIDLEDIEAETEEEAIEIAKERLSSMYHLSTTGAYHDKDKVEYNIHAGQYSD